MTGDKIYEYDLDITGVTDYGVDMESILAGKERVPPQGARFDVAFEGNTTGRYRGECAASIISGCAATDASTSTSARPSRPEAVSGSLCLRTAWPCCARVSRSPISVKT